MTDSQLSSISLISGENPAGGDNLYYHVDTTITHDTKLGIYWANSDNGKYTLIKGPLSVKEIPTGTAAGNYGPFNISDNDIGGKPGNATSLVVTENNNLPVVSDQPAIVSGQIYDTNPGHYSLMLVSFDEEGHLHTTSYDLGSVMLLGMIMIMSILAIMINRNTGE